MVCADGCLVDAEGNPIPDTELNCEDECSGWNRYFVFTMLTEEQCKSIDKCGTADDITLNYYDTKTRVYALRNIPECRLSTNCFDGEPEVVQEAATLLKEYDSVAIHKKGTIVGNKGKEITVYDYYQS